MASRTLARTGELVSQDFVQRILAASSNGLYLCPAPGAAGAPGGLGTGFSAGVVGRMNGSSSTSNNHLVVTADGTDRILTVQPGIMTIVRDAGGSSYQPRLIEWELDAAVTVTITANASGTSRTDTVCLKMDMASAGDSTGSNLGTLVALAGGASNAAANAPADGNLYVPIATVVVANGATSLSQGNVTDKRMVHPSQAVLSAHVSSAVTGIANAANTQITNLTADTDKSGQFASNAWTCPLPGWYRFSGAINMNATVAVGINFPFIYLNGNLATITKLGTTTPNNTAGSETSLSVLQQLNYGDVVRWGVNSNPGAGQTSQILSGIGVSTVDLQWESF
jgi:hypothetical protein